MQMVRPARFFNKASCFFILYLFLSGGCKKQDSIIPVEESAQHMVLFYIVVNNNIKYDALESFQKIQQGYIFNPSQRILIYLKTESNRSYLLTIDDHGVDTLKSYTDENSSDPKFLKKVILDSRDIFDTETWGLVMWSHATSWKPKSKIKSFGQDVGLEMDIKDLALCLPNDLEFIVFDACTIASIEVLYELKNRAKVILASPAEILSTSSPYDKSVNDLFIGVNVLKRIAENFLEYYRHQTGLFQSATISLIQTNRLEDIARETKRLILSNTSIHPINKEDVQHLTFDTSNNVASYDAISFLSNNYEYNAYSSVGTSINQAVLFKGSTALFLGHEIIEYCGISVYLPEMNDPYLEYYNSLQWNLDSGWTKIFEKN